MKRKDIQNKVKDLHGIPGAWPQWVFKLINDAFLLPGSKCSLCYDPINSRMVIKDAWLSPERLRWLAALWTQKYTWYFYSCNEIHIWYDGKKKGGAK